MLPTAGCLPEVLSCLLVLACLLVLSCLLVLACLLVLSCLRARQTYLRCEPRAQL